MIYKVDSNLNNSDKINQLNQMILELNGLLAQANFNKVELDSIFAAHSVASRQYLRNVGIGNALANYTGWTHLNAQSGYSIWKYASVASYVYNANNKLYMNNALVNFKGQASSETATAFNKVFLLNAESGGTYHDYTSIASVEGGAGFSVMDSISDYLYLGVSTTFAGIKFEWATRGSNYTPYLEYWNGSSWVNLTANNDTLVDDTNSFMSDGHISWVIPGTWATRIINGQNKYWIRISTTTVPVTVGVCNYCIPATSVIGLLALSSTDIQNEAWAWCSYLTNIYVTIRNAGNASYEGNYFITSASIANNLKNFFIWNNPFTADYSTT